MKRLLLFELNEFNTALLEEAATVLPAPNIRRLVSLPRAQTSTEDTYLDGSLEPWVQWVSIHTGVPYGVHGIKHIGDLPDAAYPPLWQHLSDAGISSGIWGVLNGARNEAERCDFFVPDPWTFSENTHPAELQGLIDLPRFLAKNRLEVFQADGLRKMMGLARSFRRPRHFLGGLRQATRVVQQMRHDRDKAYVYFTAFEYLSAKRFFEYKRRFDPQFSLLFINMLAHAQHYYWDPIDLRENPRMRYVLAYVDRVLGLVFDGLHPDEQLVVHNGMHQFNIVGDVDHVVYRQRDHVSFLRLLDIACTHVDAHMTNDAHLYAGSAADLDDAIQKLESAEVEGEKVFELERYPDDPAKLFFRVSYGGPVGADAELQCAGQSFRFWDHFEVLGRHTGRHGPVGTLFTSRPDLPGEIQNHELFAWIVDYFRGPGSTGRSVSEDAARC